MITEPDWKSCGVSSPVPKDIRAAIGTVVIFQGSIEVEFQTFVSVLAGVAPRVMDAATSQMSYKQLMALLSSLAFLRFGEDTDLYNDFATVTARLNTFEAFRNSVAHAHWSPSVANPTRHDQAAKRKTKVKPKIGLKTTVEEFRLEDFELQLKKAAFYQAELRKLLQRVVRGVA